MGDNAGGSSAATGPEVIESPPRRRWRRRSVALAACLVALPAVAWGAAALRPEPVAMPVLAGWPATGPRARDEALRQRAWRAWARHDPSVKLPRTAMLFAGDWPQGGRTVVLLASPTDVGVLTAVVLVDGESAERYGARRIVGDRGYLTEVIEADGHSAVLALAPGATRATVTTARTGAPRAEETQAAVAGGLLFPVPDGRTATRVVLRRGRDVVLDRPPGADDSAERLPVLPLVVRETVEGGRRVQLRSDGRGTTCEVALGTPPDGAPTSVRCPRAATSP